MNRKERKSIEQKIGLKKHLRSLSRKEKFKRISQNISEGFKKQEEMKEVVRLQTQSNQDQIDNNRISSLATELMINENLDYIDALERTKETFTKIKRSNT